MNGWAPAQGHCHCHTSYLLNKVRATAFAKKQQLFRGRASRGGTAEATAAGYELVAIYTQIWEGLEPVGGAGMRLHKWEVWSTPVYQARQQGW